MKFINSDQFIHRTIGDPTSDAIAYALLAGMAAAGFSAAEFRAMI